MIASDAGKKLVIMSGCSHAGMINIIRYAKKLGGTEKTHAVLGGFHL
jgi:7,8-dihydropterin-6-yl-methyl-4-(beta-D-ribofuranosyl)aminobenzene 5'-phosphate synthase